jgi:serine/threonine protein kinase
VWHPVSRPSNVQRQCFLNTDLEWNGNAFSIGEQIGSGSFATVFLGTHVGTGQTFAIKKVPLPSGQHFRRQKESLEREIMVLRDCRSPYIVSYFGSFVDPEGANMCIVMEFLAGGTLQDVVKEYDQHGGLDEPLMHGVLTSVLKGLAYLHDRNIMHRDLVSCFICLCFFKKKKNRNQRIFSLTQMDPQNLPILVFLVS